MADFFLPKAGEKHIYSAIPRGYVPFVLTELIQHSSFHVHIVSGDDELVPLRNILNEILPSDGKGRDVVCFPGWDCMPYDRVSPSHEIMAQRISALERIATHANQPKPLIILTSAAAALQLVSQKTASGTGKLCFSKGENIHLQNITQVLSEKGYRRVDTVREPGEFTIRGGLIDLFPPDEENPFRLDLFGEQIEMIFRFDPLTQRKLDPVSGFSFHGATELVLDPEAIRNFRKEYRSLFPGDAGQDPVYQAVSDGRFYPGLEHWLPLFYPESMISFLSILPKQSTISLDADTDEAVKNHESIIRECHETRLRFSENNGKGQKTFCYPVSPTKFYLEHSTFQEELKKFPTIILSPFRHPLAQHDFNTRSAPSITTAKTQARSSPIEILILELEEQITSGKKVILACQGPASCQRLAVILREHHFHHVEMRSSWSDIPAEKSNKVFLIPLKIDHGFVSPTVALYTEQDIFGEKHKRTRKINRKADLFIQEAASLEPGDLVVHADHGVGRYEGLHCLDVDQIPHDCVCLVYEGGDKLFLPVENLELLSRYGNENSTTPLDRLGSAAWQNRKARVHKKLLEIAAHLMETAAEREIQTAPILDNPGAIYEEFVARFPWEETEDQMRAIEETLGDLASGKPMDRLICGDVGFGKTEVALRAAMVVASHGKQVAVITPTTLLCAQHYRNFNERFSGFGLRIGHLSRFASARETKSTREALAKGEIDIVIGTHSLLGENTRFRDLGLVIVDEEQHFGVKQKEKLKEKQKNVHLLTLSATPIPRTLQMALAGVRDMSLIATPPVDRVAVQTFVMPWDPIAIRDAIMRERSRGGQVFCVCPRIDELEHLASLLREIVPEAGFTTLHGQMTPSVIEKEMQDFCDRKFDLLLATNIIESGLDLPSVNTIIIYRADLLGLSQLYQLRGRVGRSKIRGYAYLTVPGGMLLGSRSQRRLEVMQTLDTLGAGFQLASHDMDIRGAGNLLGSEQSGHIREVGTELYQQMLNDAVTALRERRQDDGIMHTGETWTPQININLPVLIPTEYVSDLSVRLSLYRRLSRMQDYQEINDFEDELGERFGPLPGEIATLLDIMRLKLGCRRANIEKVDTGEKGAVITFYKNSFHNTEKLLGYMAGQKGTAFIRPDQKIVFIRNWKTGKERLKGLHAIIGDIESIAGQEKTI